MLFWKKSTSHVRARHFVPIASAYPRSGFTKAEVNENIAYVRKEVARLYVSMSFITGVPTNGIETFAKPWGLLEVYTTDDNAFHVQQMLEKHVNILRPWARRIIRRIEEEMLWSCKVSVACLVILEGLVDLDAITKDRDRLSTRTTLLGMKKGLSLSVELGNYPEALSWTLEDIEKQRSLLRDEWEAHRQKEAAEKHRQDDSSKVLTPDTDTSA